MTDDRLVEDNGIERGMDTGFGTKYAISTSSGCILPPPYLAAATCPGPPCHINLPTANPHLSAKWRGMERQWLEKNRASGYDQSSTMGATHGVYHPALSSQPRDPLVIPQPNTVQPSTLFTNTVAHTIESMFSTFLFIVE